MEVSLNPGLSDSSSSLNNDDQLRRKRRRTSILRRSSKRANINHFFQQFLNRNIHLNREPIASGTYSLVYYGHMDLGEKQERVVCKVQKAVSSFFSAFKSEYRFLKEFRDVPGIMPLYDAYLIQPHRLAFVFPFCEGNLRMQKDLSFFEIENIFKNLLETLKIIDERGYFHGDLKPENIFYVKESNQTILADFGLSEKVDRYRGGVLQSVAYRAPEVCCGGRVTGKIDIWSLGCMIFKLCVGKNLFESPYLENYFKESLFHLIAICNRLKRALPSDLGLNIECNFNEGFLDWKKELLDSLTEKEVLPEKIDLLIDLLEKMFYFENRISAEEALSHQFFS